MYSAPKRWSVLLLCSTRDGGTVLLLDHMKTRTPAFQNHAGRPLSKPSHCVQYTLTVRKQVQVDKGVVKVAGRVVVERAVLEKGRAAIEVQNGPRVGAHPHGGVGLPQGMLQDSVGIRTDKNGAVQGRGALERLHHSRYMVRLVLEILGANVQANIGSRWSFLVNSFLHGRRRLKKGVPKERVNGFKGCSRIVVIVVAHCRMLIEIGFTVITGLKAHIHRGAIGVQSVQLFGRHNGRTALKLYTTQYPLREAPIQHHRLQIFRQWGRFGPMDKQQASRVGGRPQYSRYAVQSIRSASTLGVQFDAPQNQILIVRKGGMIER